MSFELIAWVVLRDAHGRVLLARRSGTRIADGKWNLPGGHIDDGELAAEAAAREAGEEIGALLEPSALVLRGVQRFDVVFDGERSQGMNLFFEADTWQGDLSPGEATSELGWFPVDELPHDALAWLPTALRSHLVEGHFWVETVSEG